MTEDDVMRNQPNDVVHNILAENETERKTRSSRK